MGEFEMRCERDDGGSTEYRDKRGEIENFSRCVRASCIGA